jgi:mRNA interferase MazF
VIVSNDISNNYSNRVQVIPATSATQKLYPPECYVKIKGKHSKVMADQIMTVSKERLYDCMGSVTLEEMDDIQRILLIQLGIKIH